MMLCLSHKEKFNLLYFGSGVLTAVNMRRNYVVWHGQNLETFRIRTHRLNHPSKSRSIKNVRRHRLHPPSKCRPI
jgi:hypothetical protein